MFFFFFFNDTATTEIYTLSLHDALPISRKTLLIRFPLVNCCRESKCFEDQVHAPADMILLQQRRDVKLHRAFGNVDRKSTRLNSSHSQISYAVFCLKKKKITLSSNDM